MSNSPAPQNNEQYAESIIDSGDVNEVIYLLEDIERLQADNGRLRAQLVKAATLHDTLLREALAKATEAN